MVAETDIGSTYQDRRKVLLDHCSGSFSPSCDISNRAAIEVARRYPLAFSVIFQVQSKSLMYCAVPKVATKTLLTIMIYTHLLAIREHFNKNLTNIHADHKRVEHSINIAKFNEEIRKQGIEIPKGNSATSIASFVETYLHLFRSDSSNNNMSIFHRLNPWRLDLGKVFPQNRLSVLSNLSQIFSPSFTRFLFVRHPFERLASAYKERIALLENDRVESEPDYDRIRRTICIRYTKVRTNGSASLGSRWCDNIIPSFEDFVRFLLQSARIPSQRAYLDYHWQPYSIICQVCKFKYNFIGKYETFHEDFSSLLKRLNISDWNIGKRKGASGFNRLDYQTMFSFLPDELICPLRDLYADDLRLFNYRLEDYVQRPNLTCAKPIINSSGPDGFVRRQSLHNMGLRTRSSNAQLDLRAFRYSTCSSQF